MHQPAKERSPSLPAWPLFLTHHKSSNTAQEAGSVARSPTYLETPERRIPDEVPDTLQDAAHTMI
eukprot:356753-Chlamydomonas_euryale.AAC.1